LYLQFAKAVHDIDHTLRLGGPSLQDIEQSQVPGRIEFGKAGWFSRFLAYLKRHDQLDKFSFFSFEWYPFEDDCQPQQLVEGTGMLTDALRELQQGGLTHDIPWIISEYGYSAFGARAEVDLDGALLNADAVGHFLTLGGDAAYLYGYEPSEVISEQSCSSGNNMLFFRDDAGHITKPTASYWGARLLTQKWVKPGDEVHEIYPAVSNVRNRDGQPIITAYAVHRPDSLWSLLLINKDRKHAYLTTQIFRNNASGSIERFAGQLDLYQYSHKQYVLGGPPNNPYPIKADEPEHRTITSLAATPISLPPYSLTVLRGKLNPGPTR
jgi:hypothetical protein